MKRSAKFLLSIPIFILLYFLFEPIVLHNFGRNSLPNLTNLNVNAHSNFENADKILERAFSKLQTPGLSAAIGVRNKIMWSNTIGYSDIKNKILTDSLTKFRIGSTSKAITSAGLGVLIQNRQLYLESKVVDFVSYSSDELSVLTLEQLASHTSGIRNYNTCLCFPIWEYYNNDTYSSVKESVHIFNNDPLLFEPGTDFSYSSYNYTLLSAMIEGSSKKDFLEFMEAEVFKPLGLRNTTEEKKELDRKNVALFYDVENKSYKTAYDVNNSNKLAGGGFLSTPSDMVKFGNAMLNNELLDSITSELIFKPIKLKNGKVNEQNYALGWRNDTTESIFNGKRLTQIIHHGGVALGSTSLLILFPEYNISIALVMNRSGKVSGLFELAFELIPLFIK